MNEKKERIPYKIIICAVASFLVIKAVGFDIKQIEGHSMEPTILPGQFIIINRLEYGILVPFLNKYLLRWKKPAAGEIVAAKHPVENKVIIKRCMATGGDSLFITDDYIIANSKIIPWGENYIRESLSLNQVPGDKILIIGDNYFDSLDSRSFGFVSNLEILGRVIKL